MGPLTEPAAEPRPGREPLAQRLRRRIRETGPITFADFMDAALYDPDAGFYSRHGVGEGGDFVTSPHVSPVFGLLLARQLEEMWELLERPEPFWLIEAGAGDGTLARAVLAALPAELAGSLVYAGVERSPRGQGSLVRSAEGTALGPDRLIVVPDLDDLPPADGRSGCVLANELLDNLPFHRIRRTDRGVVELFVGLAADGFVLQEGPPSAEEIVRLAPALLPGQEGVVSVAARRFVERSAAALGRGYVLLFDYGVDPARPATLVHGYRAHRVEADVLADPGSCDITAGVDVHALAAHARALGLAVWGPVTQRDALVALGFREWDRHARGRQAAASNAGRGAEGVRVYSARTRAGLLVDPAGLGGFQALCLGVGTDRPPLAVRDAAAAVREPRPSR